MDVVGGLEVGWAEIEEQGFTGAPWFLVFPVIFGVGLWSFCADFYGGIPLVLGCLHSDQGGRAPRRARELMDEQLGAQRCTRLRIQAAVVQRLGPSWSHPPIYFLSSPALPVTQSFGPFHQGTVHRRLGEHSRAVTCP